MGFRGGDMGESSSVKVEVRVCECRPRRSDVKTSKSNEDRAFQARRKIKLMA